MNEVAYEAFFDELGQIEKRAMLAKTAVNPLALGNVARVGAGMVKNPLSSAKMLGKIWQTGVKSAPKGADALTRAGKGVGALWNTPGGRAAVLGGGAALGAGGLATAYGLGRQGGRSSAAPGY